MPRASREQMEQHRHAVLKSASRLLRSAGPTAVTVSAVTASAGLTAGAFYKQFASKDALLAEAGTLAVEQRRQYLKHLITTRADPTSARDALISAYLSDAHIDTPEIGCIIPALATDVARDPESPLTDAYAVAVSELVDLLADGADHEKALSDLTTLVGAVVLARAIRGSETSTKILKAAESTLLHRDAEPES